VLRAAGTALGVGVAPGGDAVGAAVARGVGDGVAVGLGVGVGVGVGWGFVTVVVGPSRGAGCGFAEIEAWNVTCQVPTGSFEVPSQVPSCALPLTLSSVIVTLPASAQTSSAFRVGPDEV
jgi:hypothetical protein